MSSQPSPTTRETAATTTTHTAPNSNAESNQPNDNIYPETGLVRISVDNFHPRLRVYPLQPNIIEAYQKFGKVPCVRKESESCEVFNMTWRIVLLGWMYAAITSWDLLFCNSVFSFESASMLTDSQQDPDTKNVIAQPINLY